MELKPLKSYLLTHMIDYTPKSIITRDLVKKETGNVSISALDKGEIVTAKVLVFDNLIQIIEGVAEVIIDQNSIHLKKRTSYGHSCPRSKYH